MNDQPAARPQKPAPQLVDYPHRVDEIIRFGDLDPQAQVDAAAQLPGPCDYLVLPGGGKSAPAPELLAAARPEVLIASVAAGTRLARGLPPALLRRTDQEGTVELPM